MENSLTPQKFELTLLKRRIIKVHELASGAMHFTAPATHERKSKLYAVLDRGKLVYVGITNQSIKNRLRQGQNATGQHGYYGYQWLGLKAVEVWIWTFPDCEQKEVESIEAEVVYNIRNKTGNWPKYQTEIHFSQATAKNKKIAKSIADILLQS